MATVYGREAAAETREGVVSSSASASASSDQPHDHDARIAHEAAYGSDDDNWSDAGDLAFGWADAEDPLRGKVEALPRPSRDRKSGSRSARGVGAGASRSGSRPSLSSLGSSRAPGGVKARARTKEAIRVPDSVPDRLLRPTQVQKLLARMVRLFSGRAGGGGGRQGFVSEEGLKGKALLYFTTVFVSLGVFLFGYDQGVMSGIIT